MSFMETQSEVSKNDEEPLSDTDDECDHDKDETLDDSEQSLKQHVVISKTVTSTTKAARDGEEEVQETHGEGLNPIMQRSPSQGPESQGNCEASNKITRVHDFGVTSVIFKQLMETGVFNGTGVLEKIAQQENQSNATGLEDLKILAKEWIRKHPAYEDKGVRVGTARNSPTRPDTQPPSNVTNHRLNITNELTKGTATPHYGYHERKSPLRTYDPKQRDVDPQPEPTHLPAVPRQSTENDTNELSVNQNPTEAEEKQVSGINGQRQSVSQISEGGHHYIRCLDQEDRLRPAHQNHQGDPTCVQPFLYQNTPLHLETQPIGQLLYHRWELHDGNMSPAELFHHQYPYQHVPMVLPMVYPEMYYTQHGKQDDNIPLAESYDNHNDETMHEFIERMEGEAISRWDEPHQFLDDQYIGSTADLLEDEFSILPNEPNLLEDSDSELYRVTDPIWDVLWPGHQSEPTIHDLQPLLGYRRSSDNQGYHSAGCIIGEPSWSEVEMPGFWRPNRF
ncbi:hypothetical protein NW762_000507 [Fusarium torreyae]|uniref:Uncharacterized protein n=1 Tax=Fusarium torreyae TaxID=1237075 RepID=A0A9W8SIJ9_9HYPO|nr:hypothetical protein NW762_000507 [Fusarium torreyae]